MTTRWSLSCLLALILLGLPRDAVANVGLPLIIVFLPPMWTALLPVVLLEAAVAARRLDIPLRRSAAAMGVANVVSTIVGVPVLWVVLATVELAFFETAMGLDGFWRKLYAVTVQGPWLIPYSQQDWMVPTALAIMALPCLALSVLVEAPILARVATKSPRGLVWRTVAVANGLSYLSLALLLVVVFFLGESAHTFYRVFEPIFWWFAELAFRFARVLTGT